MDELISTDLFYDSKVVNDYLGANNIKTVDELLALDVDYIEDKYLKNLLRGLKDLLQYKYHYRPLPFDTYLNTLITFKFNDNAYLTVDFGIIDFHRMGLSFSEKLDLKAWAKILYNQYDVKEITLIELMKSFVKYGKDTNLAKKLSVFIDYYEKDEKMVKGENTMSKLLYLKNKLDVIYDRKVEVVVKRKGLGEKNESRRIN